MTPPIGFRTDTNPDGSLKEIRPAASLADAAAPRAGCASSSRVADYAYRIAALTAGIALLASVW